MTSNDIATGLSLLLAYPIWPVIIGTCSFVGGYVFCVCQSLLRRFGSKNKSRPYMNGSALMFQQVWCERKLRLPADRLVWYWLWFSLLNNYSWHEVKWKSFELRSGWGRQVPCGFRPNWFQWKIQEKIPEYIWTSSDWIILLLIPNRRKVTNMSFFVWVQLRMKSLPCGHWR